MTTRRRHMYGAEPDSPKPENRRRYTESRGSKGLVIRKVLWGLCSFHQDFEAFVEDHGDEFWASAKSGAPQFSQDLIEETKSLRETCERLLSKLEIRPA